MENVIRLNNGQKYVVSCSVSLKGRQFCQLIDVENADTIIAENIGDSVVFIEDTDLKTAVLLEMAKKLNKKRK